MSIFSILFAIFIIVFIVLIIKYIFYDANTLISAVQNAQVASTISAASLPTNGTGASSSNYAYSIWFYINDWNYRYGETKVILGRMSGSSTSSTSESSNSGVEGVGGIDPCPLIALGAIENNITCSQTCFAMSDTSSNMPSSGTPSVVHTCSISNIPLQKWVNLVVSVYNQTMDIYLNGKLVRTCILPGLAKINSSADLHITPNGGFSGYTSNIAYYPMSKNPQEVYNIYTKGYRGGGWGNIFSSYQVSVSLQENGITQSSITV